MTAPESSGPPIPDGVAAIRDAVAAVPGVRRIELTGSGATGDRTALSDWDFNVEIASDQVLDALEPAVRPLPTLALFWDPLSARANLIALIDGPLKVDVIVPDAGNPAAITRWTVTDESLPRLDAHFWDWTLWLASKRLRGNTALVDAQLARMWAALLEPLGAAAPPTTIDEAITSFLEARQRRVEDLGARIDPRLGEQVRTVLAAHGIAAHV